MSQEKSHHMTSEKGIYESTRVRIFLEKILVRVGVFGSDKCVSIFCSFSTVSLRFLLLSAHGLTKKDKSVACPNPNMYLYFLESIIYVNHSKYQIHPKQVRYYVDARLNLLHEVI